MSFNEIDIVPTAAKKRIALVAHDNKKKELFDWVAQNTDKLKPHYLCGTGTTSTLIREKFGLEIKSFLSGPVGGDQQLGAAIAERRIDVLVFFWDPLEMQPHDPDVRALMRIAVLHDVIIAMNPSTANFVFNSEFMNTEYTRIAIDNASNLETRVKNLSQE